MESSKEGKGCGAGRASSPLKTKKNPIVFLVSVTFQLFAFFFAVLSYRVLEDWEQEGIYVFFLVYPFLPPAVLQLCRNWGVTET